MKKFDIELTDGTHKLFFDHWAFYQFEDVEGKSVTRFLDSEFGIKQLVHLVWAGLLHEEEDLSIKEVAKLIPPGQFEEQATLVGQAINDAMDAGRAPEEQGDEAKNPKADRGTGKSGSE